MKKLFLRSVLTFVALVIAAGASHAQTPQETPESVAKAYFTAMQASDWAKCASFMHPDALAAMKRTFATILNADKTDNAAKTIFKLRSGAEYAQLSEAAVFERLMDFITSVAPDMKTALAASTNSILGRVDENPDLVHIVYRTQTKLAGAEMSEVDLISFKKQGSTWRALLTSDMEEMLNKFAEGMTPPSKEEEKGPAPAEGGRPKRKP
jgi:hypothetical protein